MHVVRRHPVAVEGLVLLQHIRNYQHPTSHPATINCPTWKSFTRDAEELVRMGAKYIRACDGYKAPPGFKNLSRANSTEQQQQV